MKTKKQIEDMYDDALTISSKATLRNDERKRESWYQEALCLAEVLELPHMQCNEDSAKRTAQLRAKKERKAPHDGNKTCYSCGSKGDDVELTEVKE